VRRSLAVLFTSLSLLCSAAPTNLLAQGGSRADANQLHAAIVNGDVESLRYWLNDRHANASAANAAEPAITPLGRCVGLAARTLGATHDSSPVIRLSTLQAMVTLLYQRGARLSDAERRQFSGPTLRWYDDTVSTPAAPASASKAPAAAAPTDGSSKPAFTVGLADVVVTTNPRESCNRTGHAVFLVNHTQLSVTASVTISEDAVGATSPIPKSDSYTVDPDSSWRLGCDTSTDGRSVRYVMQGWR
jgi:hypothetical protein